MNNNYQNQFEKIKKLYENGQVEIPSKKLLEAMSRKELEKFIGEAERVPAGKYKPASDDFKALLVSLVNDRELDIALGDLDFISLERGRRYYWMCKKSESRGVRSCTPKQYKRIKSLIKGKFIDYMADGKIKMLSFKQAQRLIHGKGMNLSKEHNEE